MSDDRLQALRRAWEASRRVEDEGVYLVERVRCGELSEQELRVLAELGYPAALAMATATRGEASVREGETAWLSRLREWPPVLVARLFVATLHHPMAWTPSRRTLDDPIAQLEEWILCPCKTHERASYLKPTAPGFERNARTILPWLLPGAEEVDLELLDRAWLEIRREVVESLVRHEPDPVALRVNAR